MNEINQNLLNGLNPSQLDAIQALEGPVLVLGRIGQYFSCDIYQQSGKRNA